jgi:hypothetical protein
MNGTTRYFLTYRGVALPLALVEEVGREAIANRGTYFEAIYDETGRIVRCQKLVYGDIEFAHDYEYDAQGKLLRATIATSGDDPQILSF